MTTLYIAGYHDCFSLDINQLREHPCFTSGKLFIAETPLKNSIYNVLKQVVTREDFKNYLLNLGITETPSGNISQLIELNPKDIILWGIDAPPERDDNAYGTIKDVELTNFVKEILSKSSNDITVLCGSAHAKYMFNELNFQDKIFYDFRREQASYNPLLRYLMQKHGLLM